MSLFDKLAAQFFKLPANARPAVEDELAVRARAHLDDAGKVFDDAEPVIRTAEEAVTGARRQLTPLSGVAEHEAAMNGLWTDPRLTEDAQSGLEVLGHAADEKLTLVYGASDELDAARHLVSDIPGGHPEIDAAHRQATLRQVDLVYRAREVKDDIFGSHEELFDPYGEDFEGYYLGP
jgi:hypothetical protein